MSAKTNNLYTLLKAGEKQTRKIIIECLRDNGYDPIIEDDFIYAEGTVPVMLLAHYDTVPNPPKFIKNDRGVLSGFTANKPTGLGADDRAGIYAILKLIERHHVHVLFTGGEETGGIGAHAFTKSGITPAVNYCIQLDRRGENDAVYYDGDNEEFEDFITEHGWRTAFGSFTDICVVCPYLGVMGVNLSIGYQNEHKPEEILDTNVMNRNIERIPALLDGKKFEYKESYYRYGLYGKDYEYSLYDMGFDDGYQAGLQDGVRESQSYHTRSYEYTKHEEYDYYVHFRDGDGDESIEEVIGVDMFSAVGYFLMLHSELTYDSIISVNRLGDGSYYRNTSVLRG